VRADSRFRAVLFDLDGTLLDTLADLGESMNAALAEIGAPGHRLDAYRRFVGDGVAKLAERALPEGRRDEATIGACVSAMGRIYGARWDRKTRPYPGIEETVEALRARGIAAAVLSNKPHDLTRAVVARFFPPDAFAAVEGARPDAARKPDPGAALAIAARLAVAPADVLYVGDTNTDMQTAVRAGMYAVGALWGFRDAAELAASGAQELISTPGEVLELLDASKG
jgi:phosphoglycolate phosphatase